MLTIFLLIILLSDLIDLHHWWWIYLLEYSSQGHDISHFSSHTAAEMNYQDTRPLIDVGQAIISTWQLLYRRSSEKVYTIFLVALLFKWFSEKQCDKPKWYYCKVICRDVIPHSQNLGFDSSQAQSHPWHGIWCHPCLHWSLQRSLPVTKAKAKHNAVHQQAPPNHLQLWHVVLHVHLDQPPSFEAVICEQKHSSKRDGFWSLRSMSLSVLQNNVLHAKHMCRMGLLRVVTRFGDASWIMLDPMRFHSALDI